MFKDEKLLLALPPIKGSKALPAVFSQEEIKQVLKTPKLLKHRVLFALIYDCGLRISEVKRLEINNLSIDRQQLKFHPHVHFIVPAGGLDEQKQWKNTKQNGNFLFDVKQMSSVYSARFASRLRKLKREGKIIKYVPRDLIKDPWVIYAKKAFGAPESVVEYLGRYTHRVAISNARILKVTDTEVTFSWCDRKNGYQKKTETLPGEVFLARFIEHIVPPYFRRIRHYGFLSTRCKTEALRLARESLEVEIVPPKLSRTEVLELRFGERSLLHCKSCGGELVLLASYPKERAPPALVPIAMA